MCLSSGLSAESAKNITCKSSETVKELCSFFLKKKRKKRKAALSKKIKIFQVSSDIFWCSSHHYSKGKKGGKQAFMLNFQVLVIIFPMIDCDRLQYLSVRGDASLFNFHVKKKIQALTVNFQGFIILSHDKRVDIPLSSFE